MADVHDEFTRRLEALEAELVTLNISEILKSRTEEQIAALLQETQELIQLSWKRQQEHMTQMRIATALERLADLTTKAQKRQEKAELAAAAGGGRPAFARFDKLEAEGQWLKHELAGPPPVSAHATYLTDASRPVVPRSIDSLFDALLAKEGKQAP